MCVFVQIISYFFILSQFGNQSLQFEKKKLIGMCVLYVVMDCYQVHVCIFYIQGNKGK